MKPLNPNGHTWSSGYLLRWNTVGSRITFEVFAPATGELIHHEESDAHQRKAALRCAQAAIAKHLALVTDLDDLPF
ncbi:MAG: hypothetical protein F6J87_31100 [Spirulina sp. SIO3F2]|nr:hypothetical protein [Spirulina sp. SIO3F2]